MSRPDFDPAGTVRVLGYDYEIRATSSADSPTNDGTSDMGRALIRVDVERAPDHVAQVTLHEIVHAVDEATGAGLSEKQVARLARGLYAVCRDNPAYMRALLFADAEPSPYANAPDLARAVRPDAGRTKP